MEVALKVLDIASYVVGAGAILTMLVIVFRKMRVVASIDTASVPKHQQEKKRKELASLRLMRKFERAGGFFGRFIKPPFARFGNSIGTLVKKLTKYERKIALSAAEQISKLPEQETVKKVEELFERAREKIASEDLKAAEQTYIELISVDPVSVKAYKELGDLYMTMKEYTSAKETYEYIIRLEEKKMGKQVLEGEQVALTTEMADHHGDLARSLIGLGKYPEASKQFEEALRLEPNNPKYLDLLIDVNIQMKKKPEAEEALARLKEANPENQKIAEFEEMIKAID